ncbi:MAG: hypothetical protein Kow0069_36230 [Promethearchaeota archaeon]
MDLDEEATPGANGKTGDQGGPEGEGSPRGVLPTIPQLIEALDFHRRQLSKKVERRLRDVFKDVEIGRRRFGILLLLGLSIGSILILSVNVYVKYLGQVEPLANQGLSLLGGSAAGLAVATALVDALKRRFPFVVACLVTSGVTLGLYRFMGVQPSITWLPNLVLALNGFTFGALTVFLVALALEYTKILERGRVLAIVVSTSSFTSLGLFFLVALGLDVVAAIFPVTAAVYLHKHRDEDSSPKLRGMSGGGAAAGRLRGGRRAWFLPVDPDLTKFTIVIGAYALVAGALLPLGEIEGVVRQRWLSLFTIALVTFSIVAGFVAAFLTGYSFDFLGRKFTISLIMLGQGVLNFVRLFQITQYQNLLFSFTSIFSLIILIPLVVGEFARPINYGKTVAMEFLVLSVGFAAGVSLTRFVERDLGLGVSSLAVVLVLFILANTSERVSPKEANWPHALHHLWVVHESGVLLYEHQFVEEELADSDLVSGGIIGLVTMLKEITRGGALRTIDHGAKKITFRYSGDGQVIFALLCSEELVVLHNKLVDFSEEFERRYSDLWRDFRGVKTGDFSDAGSLVEKHFTRKYLSDVLSHG